MAVGPLAVVEGEGDAPGEQAGIEGGDRPTGAGQLGGHRFGVSEEVTGSFTGLPTGPNGDVAGEGSPRRTLLGDEGRLRPVSSRRRLVVGPGQQMSLGQAQPQFGRIQLGTGRQQFDERALAHLDGLVYHEPTGTAP